MPAPLCIITQAPPQKPTTSPTFTCPKILKTTAKTKMKKQNPVTTPRNKSQHNLAQSTKFHKNIDTINMQS